MRASKAEYAEPDPTLIGELLEIIERDPPGQEARILLMQHYAICGWHDAAEEEAHLILKIDSCVKEAQTYLKDTRKADARSKGKGRNPTKAQRQRAQAPSWRPSPFPIISPEISLQELEDGYTELLNSAELLLHETKVLKDLKAPDCEDQILDLTAISKGQLINVIRVEPLEGVNIVAELIVAKSKDGDQSAIDIAVKDLENSARWLRKMGDTAEPYGKGKGKGKATGHDDQDGIREVLIKRVKALKALLPKWLQPLTDLAMMHAEHEFLQRKYINDETMVSFEPISEIPRNKFWASEDGYAWDMEELAGAIRSGKGVMRNPLSRQMFTRADIRAIVHHPLGKGLRALQVEQSKLKRGVRPQTVNELDTLAKVLLADMTEDGKASHLAVEAFVSYLETLPNGEQKAIDDLKVPAKDSHTGMSFDTTIGEAVKDVQANRVCSHKTGDFLAQAVNYLE